MKIRAGRKLYDCTPVPYSDGRQLGGYIRWLCTENSPLQQRKGLKHRTTPARNSKPKKEVPKS